VGVLTELQLESLRGLHADLRVYTDGWLEAAIRLLEAISSSQNTELVLVTNSDLASAFVKLILFKLARFFKPENVCVTSPF
jgi:hypothetical protein